GRGDDALGRYVEMLSGIPQVFAPGSAYGYSNASACIAGWVATQVMQRPWEQLVTERVLGLLEMRHSALFAEDLLQHPVALGYKAVSGSALERSPLWSYSRSQAP